MVLCVASFLPFQTRYWINGHHFIAGELQRQGVRFRKDDNADSWTWVLGPKFSKKDRAAINLRRHYSLNQVEYCLNFIFQRNFPIHKIFERSGELGLFRLTADKIAQIFGVPKHKRLRGKLHSLLEKARPRASCAAGRLQKPRGADV
jgi:hypothetical protein